MVELGPGKRGKTGRGVRRVERHVRGTRLAVDVKDPVVSEYSIRTVPGFSDERAGPLPAYPSTRIPVLSDGYQDDSANFIRVREGMHSPGNEVGEKPGKEVRGTG